MGLFTERVTGSGIPFQRLLRDMLGPAAGHDVTAERFCDDGEGEINRYNVYKLHADGAAYVLKKTDIAEIFVYERLLAGQSFPVPGYYGHAEWGQDEWLLLDYVEGTDLRDFTAGMAHACAKSIVTVMNAYWQDDEATFRGNRLDDRFDRYWKRICERAKCLTHEPLLKSAYQIFLERQLSCPRTLCNGDFLQYNGIYRDGTVWLIDWAFAGIMPYALDIARLIAHGSENREGFPFYMTDEYRHIFVWEVYDGLRRKPTRDRYVMDIKLAMLNEYIEFLEDDLNGASLDRDDPYYGKALKIAEDICGRI